VSERQIHRLLGRLKTGRDGAVIYGLRGRPSARKRSQKEREKIVQILPRRLSAAESQSWLTVAFPTNAGDAGGASLQHSPKRLN
jgi:hypothetical protein